MYIVLLAIFVLSEVTSLIYRGEFGFLRVSRQPPAYREVSIIIKVFIIISSSLLAITLLAKKSYLDTAMVVGTVVLLKILLYVFCKKRAVSAEIYLLTKPVEPITGLSFEIPEAVKWKPLKMSEAEEVAAPTVNREIRNKERLL